MNDRDCEKCKHHTEKGCDSWDCKYEPCEDAISRQAVLDMVEDMTDQFGNKHRVVTEGLISMLPPVKPQVICPSHGIDCEDCPAYEPKTDVLDKIRTEIERQEKWLLQAGYTSYNADIAFDAIKSVVAESEDKE